MKMAKVATENVTGIPDEKPLDYTALHAAFAKAMAEAYANRNAKILRDVYDTYPANTDYDKKPPMDQVFREMLLYQLSDDIEGIGALVRLSVEAVRLEITSITIPVVLLGDIFDAVTVDMCERIFGFVEEMVEVWKEDIFFGSCKNNILRMCNDLLRRLSRAQNTVFCGRILLFLSKFFPFSERSGLNIVSEFNLDNVTEYGVDGKDLDDALEDTVEDLPIKIDYNLYCKFWSLQDFFRNPNQCYSKAQWKMFQAHASTVLEAFGSFKLEEPRVSTTASSKKEQKKSGVIKMEVDNANKTTITEMEHSLGKKEHFFAKFLTNPKLLALQLSDSNFRRSVLVQFLIMFQYLQITVKFKTESNTLTPAQAEFIKETETKVYQLLEETPPNGKRFARTVRHMLSREEMWNNWKNEGCKEFKKPEQAVAEEKVKEEDNADDDQPTPAKKVKRTLGDSLRIANHSGRFFLGNDVLTRLWNYSPDNLQACKSEERNFLPNLESYLETAHEPGDASFEWRALRLMARQSPHFFIFLNSPSCKIHEYLETVRKKLARERQDQLSSKTAVSTASEALAEAENSGTVEANEQETMALQEQEGEHEAELDEDEDHGELDKEDDNNAHAHPVKAKREHIEEIAPLIGEDWKRLGKKLGYTADEVLYFETEHSERDAACIAMLSNWFADDDDASLDNWAYMLEGLGIHSAAKAVKALIQRLTGKEPSDDVEVLSD